MKKRKIVKWLESKTGLIGIQDTVKTAILGLRNYTRNNKKRLINATRTIENDEGREGPNEYKKRKKNEKKTKWTKNYMDSPSGKQRVKQVKIGGEG